jgi:hypothetical protein
MNKRAFLLQFLFLLHADELQEASRDYLHGAGRGAEPDENRSYSDLSVFLKR